MWIRLFFALGLSINLSAHGLYPTADGFVSPSSGSAYALSESRIASIFQDVAIGLPKKETLGLARHLINLCRIHTMDPALVLGLIDVESRFNVHAVSPMGAVGLMQLMPATAQLVAHQAGLKYSGPRSLTNPYTNLSLGVRYLAQLRDRYQHLPPYYHLAAYNLGPARLDYLMSRKSGFRPTKTKLYYESIQQGAERWRMYDV